jgi:trehalose 6-phosphate phosphatase
MISAVVKYIMRYVFEAWDSLSAQIKSSKRLLLLFDYDGTLTPIVESPEAAVLSDRVRLMLRMLSQKKNATVGIVSGRALGDLQSRVGLPNIIYAGNHGLEIEGPRMSFLHPVAEEIKATLHVMYAILKKALAGIPGAFVENKGLTLSVHFRQVGDREQEGEVTHIFNRIVGVAKMLNKVKITSGKKVFEIRPPVSWDKGKAIKMMIERNGDGEVLPVYTGDDLTDEDAFLQLKDGPGISIYVGTDSPESAAKYQVNSPEEVEEFLIRLNGII